MRPANGRAFREHIRSRARLTGYSSLITHHSSLLFEALFVCLVVGLLCLCYLSLRWYGFDLLEEGYFLTNARAVQLGHLPYRDFDTPYTPGIFYLYAWLLDRFGPHVTVLRTLQIGGRVLFFVALYVCGRHVMPPFFAALAPATIMLMDTAPETWGIHPGWLSSPAAILAALGVARYVSTGRSRWLFLSGVASGIGFAFKQNLPAYGLIAALWFLVVAERHLPPLALTEPLARGATSSFRRHLERLVSWVRGAVQALALALLPLVSTAIVWPYLSGLVFCLFVLPLLALSLLASFWLIGSARTHHSSPITDHPLRSVILRPLLVLAGFSLVTFPWLVLMLRALDWNARSLGVLVGQVDPTGYFYGMKPPTLAHVRVVAWTLLVPVALGSCAAWGFWSRRGIALALAGLSLFVAAQLMLPASGGEPWHVIRGGYILLRAATSAWRDYGNHPHFTSDLILYLPVVAFWAALAYVIIHHSSLITHHLMWFLAAGAALFLNQYPRMDEIHWLWSAGLLLLCGAAVLHAWYVRALWLAPALARSAAGRAALRLSLAILPLVAVFPHVWLRSSYWPSLVPAPPEEAHAATSGARVTLAPLAMPDGQADVWVSAGDRAAIQEVIEMLVDKTAPNEPIFTYPAIPGFYFLADRPNATRFNHLFKGIASPADQEEIVRRLDRVRYIVWDDGGAHFWVVPGDNAPVTEYVRTHFRVERFIGPYAVLSRDAQGPSLPYFLPGGSASH